MNEDEFAVAQRSFQNRLESLANDVSRCFWPIDDACAPNPAYFSAVMYCFATLNYFVGHWAGKNQDERNQTGRLVCFLEEYLLYGRRESLLAVHFWRHKLMHTGEPRDLRDKNSEGVYVWSIGGGIEHHTRLVQLEEHRYGLGFNPCVFVKNLQQAIFGPNGYFEDLRTALDLQDRHQACLSEMNSYRVSFEKLEPEQVPPHEKGSCVGRPAQSLLGSF